MMSIDALLNNIYWNDDFLNKEGRFTLFTTIHHGFEATVFGNCEKEYQIAYSIIQRERKKAEYTLSGVVFKPFKYIQEANLETIEKVFLCIWIDAFLQYENKSKIPYNDAAQNKYWKLLKNLKKLNIFEFKDNLKELNLDESFQNQLNSYLKDRCLNNLIKIIVNIYDNKSYN